jgi:hypothetical protein
MTLSSVSRVYFIIRYWVTPQVVLDLQADENYE